MKQSKYIVGIDLGTTHTVVAYALIENSHQRTLWQIPQWTEYSQIERLPYLPSFRYHPAPEEWSPAALTLPWIVTPVLGEIDVVIIGEWARALQRKSPERTISCAKSWLSSPFVDRVAAILPWGDQADIPQVSPVVASASYLAYLRDAWNADFQDNPFEQQQLVLTIPASFDEVARALTLEAVQLAGFSHVRLLEEPQAVFYDWIATHHETATSLLSTKNRVLVCDVGGGTTDFSLINIIHENDDIQFERVAVGDHLLLGGDNLDHALVYHVLHDKLKDKAGIKLSTPRFNQWLSTVRHAKEILLSESAPESFKVSVLGAGTNLFKSLQSCVLAKEEVQKLLLAGFFPKVDINSNPIQKKAALTDLNLRFAEDPAITRHLAYFLRAHLSAEAAHSLPDVLLLNGGVFKSPLLVNQMKMVLNHWCSEEITLLTNDKPDSAVAFGAVAFGLSKLGLGKVIGGGTARSYFLLVENERESESKEGAKAAICVLPKGTDFGKPIQIGKRFSLRIGTLVRFNLLYSLSDEINKVGDLVSYASDGQFVLLPPLVTTISSEEQAATQYIEQKKEVLVDLIFELTEIGSLRMSCIALESPYQQWTFSFDLKNLKNNTAVKDVAEIVREEEALLPIFWPSIVDEVEDVFGKGNKSVDANKIKTFKNFLEKKMGPRNQWHSLVARSLADLLIEKIKNRRRSDLHERVWLNVVGFCLRPGMGYRGDEARIRKLWDLFSEGLQYAKETQNWSEWWVFWRRLVGGLSESQQADLLNEIKPDILNERTKAAEPRKKSFEDILRLAGSLEKVTLHDKIRLVDHLQAKLARSIDSASLWWVMGRLVNRVLFYGSVDYVIPKEKAEQILAWMLTFDWQKLKSLQITAALLARNAGNTEIDLPIELRQRVLAELEKAKAPKEWIQMLTETSQLSKETWDIFYGEALPQGLLLLEDLHAK